MSRRTWGTIASVGAVLAIVALVIGFWPAIEDSESDASATTTTTSTIPVEGTTTTTTTPPVSAEAVAFQVMLFLQGFQPNEVVVGTPNIDWSNTPEERGTAAFSEKTLKTPAEVSEFLNGSEPKQVAASQRVEECIRAKGYGDDEVARAKSGEGYFAVQTKVAAQILGTTYFQDGKVLESGQWRQVEQNDVFWFYLTKDGKVLACAVVRADCANPNIHLIRAVRPDTPPAVPVDVPPSEVPKYKCPKTGLPPDEQGLCPKDQSANIDRNPVLPPWVGGPGTTPVGTSPGAATPTYDTPCGLARCTGPTSDGSGAGSGGSSGGGSSGGGSSTTVPVSSGGNTGVSAPTTTAPADPVPSTPPATGEIPSP